MAFPRRESPAFECGYTRRQWSVDEGTGAIIESSLRDTEVAAPTFGDMLDALRCTGGYSAAEVEAVTEPASPFPQPERVAHLPSDRRVAARALVVVDRGAG